MNPGVSEDVSKVAVGTVDALKSTPVILGVLLFNLGLMLFVGYLEHTNGDRWERTVERAINYCTPVTRSKTE